ncbi:MAG: TonB-dependent receptor [Bacteroidales bacterium]|nr:TonB-dependent receptor [Bacteroidales bacterium]
MGIDWIVEQYKWKLDKNEILLNENRGNQNQFSIFGIMNYRPSSRLNISMAGTLNYISYQLTDLYSANGDQSGERNFPLIVSPRIGFNYTVSDNFVVYASVGHGFSLPSPEETLLPEGDVNPDIKPEQGMQYEIGTRLTFVDKAVEIDASLYWIELNNLLVTKRITEDIFTGMNAGKTRHQGFELLLRNRFFDFRRFPGKLNSTIGYTLSRNQFIDFTDDGNRFDGNDLPGIPDQLLQLQLTWNPVNRTEMLAHLQYTGNQHLNDANTLKYNGYFWVSIKASTQFQIKQTGIFNIYAGINNLTDSHYASMLVVNAIGIGNNEPRYYYPGLPRNIYAGIEFRF